ncbi:MAG: sugar O-acetyltransferase [Clostridium sp.]
MNQKERMLNELPYKSWMDGLKEERMSAKLKVYEYNTCRPDKREEMTHIIKSLLGKTGEEVHIEQPFRCDYGSNIEVGENFYSNYNCVILDVGKVTIGKNVMFAPNVSIYTAGHPIHPDSRNSGYEYGIPVTIGDNVWVGGNVVINPGVNIGNNVVIGSGSVVTKDIPDNVIAAGNPCKVIREITEEDRKYYYKEREFDVDDYK